ncbi:serine/threonine-protein kinase PknK, partial [Corallococcus sp. AB038B]
LSSAREGGIRMETLLRVYQSRFEREQGNLEAAREAAQTALSRAVDPVLANPWDEVLARRAMAVLLPGEEGFTHLRRALALEELTGNVLQVGLVHLALAERAVSADAAVVELEAAESAFTEARASNLLAQATSLRGAL